MALTLVEASKLMKGDSLRQSIVQLFAMQTDILRELPFANITGGSYTYNQEDTLPGIAFRAVNGSYTESTGVINPQTENLVICGGDLDVDKALIKMKGPEIRGTHEAMKVKALSHTFSNAFIKGDSFTSPNEFDGLQNRLAGSQVISEDPSTAGGGALSLAKLDELGDLVDNPTHWLMTKQVRRNLTVAARDTSVGGQIDYTVDAFGRKVTTYMDLPILIADGNADQYATLANNEAATGGDADATSVYCLQLEEGYLSGIQNGEMEVDDLGQLDAKPTLRTRIEWLPGIVMEHPRAAARLRDIDAALAVTKS